MPRNAFYCQCKIRRYIKGDPHHYEEMVSWIPSGIAQKGNQVRLKEFHNDPDWDEHWWVVEVGAKRDGTFIEANADAWKHQRKVSDI